MNKDEKKLHMLSVWYRGQRHVWFTNFGPDKKPHVTEEDLKRIGVQSGNVFAIGI